MADPDSEEERRSAGDRMSNTPMVLWLMLGVVAVAVFIGVIFLIGPLNR